MSNDIIHFVAGSHSLPAVVEVSFGDDVRELLDGLVAFDEQHPVVQGEDSCHMVRETMNEAGELLKQINQARTVVKAPYFDACKKIDAAAKKAADRVEHFIARCKTKLVAYATEVERIRAAAVAAARRQEEQNRQAEAEHRPTEAIVTVDVPDSADIATVTDYELVIEDASLIPREFMNIDKVRIEKALRNQIPVAGCSLRSFRKVINK